MKAFIVFCAILALAAPAFGRILDRCSLAREMSKLGVPRNELARWACIAEHVSSYRTDLVGPSSNEYGIFQINSAYWCNPGKGRPSKNGCNVNCKALLSDNIKKSVNCARKILGKQGWGAWNFCNGALDSIDKCF